MKDNRKAFGIHDPIHNLTYVVKDGNMIFAVETDYPDTPFYRELWKAVQIHKWLRNAESFL